MRLALILPAVFLVLASPVKSGGVSQDKGQPASQAPSQLQRLMRLSPTEHRALQAPWNEAGDHPMAAYWQALAEMGLAGIAPSPKAAEALLDTAEQRLVQRKNADSYALRGALTGMRIGLHPMSAMSLAPKAAACFTRAKELEPGNPRVRLFEAIHALNTPAFFGGGPKVALPLLQEAVSCAEREAAPSDPWAPAWGKAEALAWQAQALLQVKQVPEAKAAILRSLELDPQWEFARAIRAQLP